MADEAQRARVGEELGAPGAVVLENAAVGAPHLPARAAGVAHRSRDRIERIDATRSHEPVEQADDGERPYGGVVSMVASRSMYGSSSSTNVAPGMAGAAPAKAVRSMTHS